MTLLEEILTSSVDWPDWQSDALRRLFSKGELDTQDLADIRSMVEEAEGAPVPIRLNANHVPSLGDGETTTLLELRNLRHVNRFAQGQCIDFSPTGLSVVFGENGTGKSGYSRVLKRACRARHSSAVLPDAFGDAPGTPSAQIVFADDQGNPTVYEWREGGASGAQLAMVSVYDSRCGDDYISQEGPCDYQPYGLPYLGLLARAQSEIQAVVGRERNAINLNPGAFDVLKGDHEVGLAIGQLNAGIDLNALRALSVLTDDKIKRIVEIERIQATLDVETPAKAAEALAARLDEAAQRCKPIETITSDRAVDRLHELTSHVEVALEADKVAQALLRGEDAHQLPGTGSSSWKLLFQAAQSYSIEAYPQAEEHPSTEDDAKCVLCQQELLPPAQIRLQRFRDYVAGEAATACAKAITTLQSAVNKVQQASLNPVDETTSIELRDHDQSTFDQIEPARAAWASRQQWVVDAADQGNWSCPRPKPAPQPLLSSVLVGKAQILRAKAAELRASKDEDQIKSLAKEHAGLVARRTLATMRMQLERHVEDAETQKRLTAVYNALRTQGISTQITRLSERHITEALVQAMREELAMLGYSRSPQPILTSQTRRGQNMMTLSLDRARLAPGQILSEGEQRTMGLAMFLAESRMRGDKSTIVFDDPSTSLDHRFRAKIAKRIVRLASERPVIVLTHDAVFLTELQIAGADAGTSPNFQTIQWESGAPGAVMNGLAWETREFAQQFREVHDEAKALAANSNPQLNDEEKRKIRDLHSRLRGAIERGVREIILNDVVHPFVDEIKVAKLGSIIGFTIEEWEAVVSLHDQCSGATSAHDTNQDRQQELPDPADLVGRLDAIKAVFDGCSKRKTHFKKTHYDPHMAKRSLPRAR